MSSLCGRCEQIFELAAITFKYPKTANLIYGQLGNFQTWRRNAETSSCQLCCILWSLRRRDTIQSLVQSGNQDDLKFDCDFLFGDQSIVSAHVFHPGIEETHWGNSVSFKQTGSETTLFGPTPEATWSWQSVKLVHRWLSECRSAHVDCGGISSPQRLPLRLLDLDPTGNLRQLLSRVDRTGDISVLSLANMPQLKLCSTASLPLDTPYLTLSHCWGRSPVIKLSHDNLTSFSEAIDPQLFQSPTAATFREAICAARCIGFRYLWIDALCINQEDAAEKSTEIMYMDQIYTHAALNLSATAAHDGSGGLFFQRDPLIIGPCRSREHPGLVAFAPPDHPYVLDVLRGPVNRRSWVFQERMLARRVLHFSRTLLFWECVSTLEAESFSGDILNKSVTPHVQKKKKLLPHHTQDALSTDEGRELWTDLIERYSTTAITFPQDTLLALSAIAAVVCRRRGFDPGDYAAGLWAPDLPVGLAWRVAEKPSRTAAGYVAPSWSWAALFCTVDIGAEAYAETFVYDISVTVRLANKNAFGRILGGSLRIRGYLASLHFLESEDCFRIGRHDHAAPTVVSSGFPGTVRDGLADKSYRWSQGGERSRLLDMLRSHQPPLDKSNVLICEWDYGIPSRDRPPSTIPLPLLDRSQPGAHTSVFFLLPLGRRAALDDVPSEPFDCIEGLILHPCPGKGEYIRVGMFHYTLPDDGGDNISNLILDKSGPLEEDSVLERGDGGTWLICIK